MSLRDLHPTRWQGCSLIFSRKETGDAYTSRHEVRLIGYLDLATGEEWVSHCGSENEMIVYPYFRDEDNLFNMCECPRCHQRFFNAVKHGGSFTV